jgi:hypothetical protein
MMKQARPSLKNTGLPNTEGNIPGTTGKALGSSNAQPYFSSRVRMGPGTTEEEEEEQARFNLIILLQCSFTPVSVFT